MKFLTLILWFLLIKLGNNLFIDYFITSSFKYPNTFWNELLTAIIFKFSSQLVCIIAVWSL